MYIWLSDIGLLLCMRYLRNICDTLKTSCDILPILGMEISSELSTINMERIMD